jgi:hypothetical protein
MILFLWPSSKLTASACGAGGCGHGVTRTFGGTQPPAGTPGSAHKALRRTHPTTAQPPANPTTSHPAPNPTSSSPDPQPTRSSPAPTTTPTSPTPTPTTTAPGSGPTPSPTPTSTPTSSPTQTSVEVSYALVHKHPHSFQAKFTIVNNGSTAINGWELVVELPDDRIDSVWDGQFHTDGDTLYIDPSSSQQTIAPGAALTENFEAHGSTTAPTTCAFNGSAC